jgi:hypothetical protein
MGGGLCSSGPISYEGVPISATVSVGRRPPDLTRATNWVPPLISGLVDPELGATRVEVRWTGGSRELGFANGYFIGAAEELYEAPPSALPIFVVALDASGQEVARRQFPAG